MSSDAASFIGGIPEHYDHGLGPIIFADYAADIALRAGRWRSGARWRSLPAPGLASP